MLVSEQVTDVEQQLKLYFPLLTRQDDFFS